MEEEVYFVRNADHRVPARTTTIVRPPTVTPAEMATRPPAAAPVYYPPQFAGQAPPPWWGPSPMYSAGPVYGQSPWMNQLGGFLGGLGLGDVIKLGADAFAAFKSLPTPPAPTGDVPTDVANNVVYLSALAKDATDRKKFEYAGELAGALAGRLGYWGAGGR